MRTLIVLACACSAPAKPVVAIPTIDGALGDAEWKDARRTEMAPGLSIRFLDDDTKLYFGITGKRGFSCIFLAEGDVVMVHHASAKLGTAHYVRGKDGKYDPVLRTYHWQTGEKMFSDEGWMATTMQAGATEQEIVFLKKTVGAQRIAIGYLMLPESNALEDADVGTWPANLADGVSNVQMLGGFNPDDVTFEPEKWADLSAQTTHAL